MRMLNDSPAAVVDASSAPLLASPAIVGGSLQPPAGGRSDANFDADMVVILAAMLCILACAIGLNSLIPCFRLHCGRRTLTGVAAPHAAAATMAAVPAATGAGLKKRELMRRIPVVVYEVNKAGVVVSVTDECAICLAEFNDGDKVRVLPRCHHGFHVQCIDVWLATHPSCPTCRSSLLEDDGGPSKPTPTVAGEGT